MLCHTDLFLTSRYPSENKFFNLYYFSFSVHFPYASLPKFSAYFRRLLTLMKFLNLHLFLIMALRQSLFMLLVFCAEHRKISVLRFFCFPSSKKTLWHIGKMNIYVLFWRRKWQPTPVLLPGKFHGWRSRVGYNPWSHKESDMTEQLHFSYVYIHTHTHTYIYNVVFSKLNLVFISLLGREQTWDNAEKKHRLFWHIHWMVLSIILTGYKRGHCGGRGDIYY